MMLLMNLLHFLPFLWLFQVTQQQSRNGNTAGLTVGRLCDQTTECGQGGYCAGNKLCACLSTYVEINGYCWPKINPGESGCTENRQCNAVWPGAFCTKGACKCLNNQPPFITRDGPICINYGFCPLNGQFTKLLASDGSLRSCTLDQDCDFVNDCICTEPTCDINVPGICCPSRALSCIQPLDQGDYASSGGSEVRRYYHNSQTGECQPMAYRGIKGNSNNFESKDHCESYCKQTCSRGQPQYDLPRNINAKETIRLCSSGSLSGNNACASDYECTSIGTLEYCCPKPEYICSRGGGVPYEILPPENFDEGALLVQGKSSLSRFYYDQTEKRCLTYQYTGQLGNYNNFLSQAHCEQFCSRIVCEAGEPLKDTSGVRNLKCSGSQSGCPATHRCTDGLCCPLKQTVCKLPKGIGSCGNFANRWWFNASSGNCIEFTYSGCQGNANNFGTYSECQSFCRDARVEPQCPQGRSLRDSSGNFIICGGSGLTTNCPQNHYCFFDGKTYGCCPNQVFTCSLNSDPGTKCGPTVSRWYYDSSKKTCLSFDYFGCDGSSNNFATQQDCKDYCRVESCPDGGIPFKEQTGVNRICSPTLKCPMTHYCSPVTKYSARQYQTQNYCCPKKEYICSQYKEQGVRCSSTTINRFWFNRQTKTCDRFTFNGCAGNRNNFQTKKGCMNFCLSAACPPGTVASQDISTGVLSTCNAGTNQGCPSNYQCLGSSLLGQPICCGVPPDFKDFCPNDSTPFLDAVNLQAMQCTPNVQGSCPGGYYCWYAAVSVTATTSSFYCCVNNSLNAIGVPAAPPGVCPPSLIPHLSTNGQYQSCTPGALPGDTVNGCTIGQNCLYSESLKKFLCCKFANKAKEEESHEKMQNNLSHTPQKTNLSHNPLKAQPSVCPPVPIGLTPENDRSGELKECLPLDPKLTCSKNAACLYANKVAKFICCIILGSLSHSITGNKSTAAVSHSIAHNPSQRIPQPQLQPSTLPPYNPPEGVETVSITDSDCSGAPGVKPIEVQPGRVLPCSPTGPNSNCKLLPSHFSLPFAACMFSMGQKRFICCTGAIEN